MNPFDFVPIDLNNTPERRAPITHEKYHQGAFSGTINCKITAETPIFIKSGNTDRFTINRDGQYIIPATSLKGLFRNITETVANGCFEKFDGRYNAKIRGRKIDYTRKLPDAYKACRQMEALCIACRIFGMLNGDKQHTGKVSFQDAVCNHAIQHPPIYTVILMAPKPYHQAFYIHGNHIAGRKFYFHHPQHVSTPAEITRFNRKIQPLDRGSEFHFDADFTNLEFDELQALLYSIVLEPTMRHKIGYAKPAGFGSIKIEINSVRIIDYSLRYTNPNQSITEYTGQDLKAYIDDQIHSYTQNNSSTLSTLRRIWRWDPADTTQYQYPTAVDRDWFTRNTHTSISGTP